MYIEHNEVVREGNVLCKACTVQLVFIHRAAIESRKVKYMKFLHEVVGYQISETKNLV
jgi:H2-forming N5,N10-methylenetetrahydromethanopterin dehydrogenase-like enzyme